MQLSITVIIILITALVSFSGFSSPKVINDLIFYTPAITQRNQWYRFFTCGLIHADWGHLIFNMISLYFLGRFVESSFEDLFGANGKWLYLLLYISGLFFSLLPTYLKNKNNPSYRSLGASGAVSAVIFAGLLLVPTIELYVYFIKMPGFVFAPLYMIFSIMMGRSGKGNINHSAHIWGAVYGLVFTLVACQVINFPVLQNGLASIQYYMHSRGWL
ncbi:MAG: rhomboid family intramembrane serine protease [Chitinophagaceae bacterium]